MFGRGETVFPVRPAQFIVVPLIHPPKKPSRASLHAPHQSPAAAASDTSPEMPLATATASCQGSRRPRQRPSRPTFRPAQWPVSPFVVALCPAPPVARQRAATALPRLRPSRCMVFTTPPLGFYSGPTPRLQRLTPARPGQAPATKPAPEVLPALVMPFASWITWLDGVTRQASGRMCELPPAIVSASWRDRQFWPFQRSEYRSYLLPFDHRFSPLYGPNRGSQTAFSASSSTTLTGKPSSDWAFHG